MLSHSTYTQRKVRLSGANFLHKILKMNNLGIYIFTYIFNSQILAMRKFTIL